MHLMPLGWDWELTHCKPVVLQVQSKRTAAKKERPWVYYMDSKMFYHYCFSREGSIITDHKTLVAIFKKMLYPITKTTMNSTQNTPIQCNNHLQTWTRSILGRLAVLTKSQGKQWHRYHTNNSKHPKLHNNTETKTKELHKMSTYNSSKNISSKAGQRKKIKYQKAWIHTGCF